MLVRGYLKESYKRKIHFASVNSVNTGSRWAMVVPMELIASINIVDEEVKYFDGVKKHVNKIGRLCEIDVDADFARRVRLNGIH